MAKTKRGKAIKLQINWRGTCPMCKRKRVKIVWQKGSGKDAIKICKVCHSSLTRP